MRKKWFGVLAISAVILVLVIVLFISRGFIFGKVVLRAGQPLKFGHYTVFINEIADHRLFGIKITGNNRNLEAKSGDYVYVANENAIKFNLTDGVVEDADAKNPGLFHKLTFKQMFMKIRLKRFASKLL